MVERHPDNIASDLFGGFIGAFVDTARIEIPLSEVLPKLSGDADTSLLPIPKPPLAIACYHHYRLNPDIKPIIVVPAFHSKTAEARSQLPHSYTREDVMFNIQRCALLPIILGRSLCMRRKPLRQCETGSINPIGLIWSHDWVRCY